MKILQVSPFKTTASGPTTVLKPVIQKLVEKGHTVDVFSTLKFEQQRQNLITSLGADYYPLEGTKFITSFNKLIDIVPQIENYELVHIHGVYNINHILLARLLAKKGIPYIVSTHGGLMEEALKKSKYKKKLALNLLIKNMLIKAESIHALNKQEADDISKIVPHPSIKVIPNGVDTGTFQKKKNDFSEGSLNLLFIGRIDLYHKGLDMLLDALDQDEFKDSLTLHLVGPYVSINDQTYIENRISKSENLKAIVKVEGPKYGIEKDKYYQDADFFIHTSRHEGMPMAVLESLAVGIPAIVTPGTNMVEVIKESNGGIVTAFDAEIIAQKIKTAQLKTPDEIYEMGQQARVWCQTELSWENIVNSYERYYRKSIK